MHEVDWESRYGASDTPWDKGLPHPMIAHWAARAKIDGAIVVPGCGRGWDLRAWAQAFPQNEVIGIDLAASAVQGARENCKDLANVSVHEADFFAVAEWHRGQEIGLIWEHTCFCAIPPRFRDDYVATVAGLLPSGGILIGAFFTDLDDNNAGPPWNASVEEMVTRFSPYFVIETVSVEHQTFPGREGEERSMLLRRK